MEEKDDEDAFDTTITDAPNDHGAVDAPQAQGEAEGIEGLAPTPDNESFVKQRRAALSDLENAEIAVLRREKKISIGFPSVSSSNARLNRVYISSSQYKHLMDEMKGGVYGDPSRPDLDLQTIPLPEYIIPSVDIAFDPVKIVYVLCKRVEDILLAYLSEHPKAVLNISTSICRFGPKEFQCINNERKKYFRRYVFTYLRPLLDTKRAVSARARIDLGTYDFDGVLSSDDEDAQSVFSDNSSVATTKSKKSVKVPNEVSPSAKKSGKKELKNSKSKEKRKLKKQNSKIKG